jgi:hypothetical protein
MSFMPTTAITSEVQSHGSRLLLYCCLLMILCLYVVGFESHGILRHVVQTAPLWLVVVLAKRESPWTKWTALPCFIFWLVLMTLIWLFLLGWAKVLSGTFTPVEIAMATTVGLCSMVGIVLALRSRTHVHPIKAFAVFVSTAVFQFLVLRISFLPSIAHDHWR